MQNDCNNGVRNVALDNCHLSVKIPTFFSNAEIWFSQVDAAFQISNIRNQTTMYFHLLMNLPPSTLESVAHAMDPNSEFPYDKLKLAVIKELSITAGQAMDRLIQPQSLNGRKPSRVLKELKTWSHIAQPGINVDSNHILRHQFMTTLSTNIQHHLVGRETMKLDDIAELADKYYEIEERNGSVNMISLKPNFEDQLVELTKEINWIKRHITEKKASPNYDHLPLCYYHSKFGKFAKKCQPPCSWEDSKLSGKGTGSQ